MIDVERTHAGPGALLVGYVLVFVVLYRRPASGVAAATASGQSLLYFLVLPGLGLVAGGYAVVGGPYGSVLQFGFGTYLGLFGLALTFGALLSPDSVGIVIAAGVLILGLAVASVVSSVLRVADVFGSWATVGLPD